jgi:hypothetical protein
VHAGSEDVFVGKYTPLRDSSRCFTLGVLVAPPGLNSCHERVLLEGESPSRRILIVVVKKVEALLSDTLPRAHRLS